MEINKNLTPESANELGYEWIQDVIYDPEAPAEAMKDISDKVESGEFALGLSASSNTGNNLVGLYKKI